MKQYYGDYKYKGFLINFSEYYQSWRLEVTLDLIGEETDEALDFACEYNNSYSEEFRTINQAKKYIDKNYKELVKEVKNLYNDFKED